MPKPAPRMKTPPSSPRAERRADTRQRLLDAAGQVFARRGYHEASLDAIAARAGLTKGAVYYNFKSKEDLFVTLLAERLGERLADVEQALVRADDVDPAFERKVARGFFDRIERDPRWMPLFFEFVAFAGRDARTRRAFAERFVGRARAGLAELIERRFRAVGVTPAVEPAHLAIAIDALANGLALERMMTPDEVPDELFGQILALLFGALAGEESTHARDAAASARAPDA